MAKKTPEQVVMIEEVQRAVEAAAAQIIDYLKTDEAPVAERCHEIIDEVLESRGCESLEGHIVAGGLQSAEPHETGNGLLKKGEPIVIDIYPRSKTTGYFADMSRTVCIGRPPERLQKMYNAVLAAQELAIGMVKPGAKCVDIQTAVEKYFAGHGFITSGKGKEFAFAEGFVHGVGHGVGLQIHEVPRVGRGSKDILEEGDVVTIEPGLYYKDIGGVRIEDMVLVTKGGCRSLTNFPKQFSI